jgi:hypothetical protein
MLFYTKALTVRVAKYVKVPLDSIHQKNIRFSYPEQYFFHQRVAYVFDVNEIQSKESTQSSLLLQKKQNMLLYLKFHVSALNALLILGSLSQEHYKMHYKVSSLNNMPDLSTKHRLRFLGIDNELYTAYHLNNEFRIVRISDGATVYELSGFKEIGFGLPLYNNFIPIVTLIDNSFIITIYDITSKTSYKIANYSIEFLEKQLADYINKLIGRDVSNSIKHYDKFYKILEPYRFTNDASNKSFDICNNLSVCKTVLYIGNKALQDRDEHIVFKMNFKIRNQKLYYEFSIPRGLFINSYGLIRTPTKHVIENRILSIRFPKGNYTTPNILYYQNHYMIVRDFFYINSYYILDLKKSAKNRISDTYGYGIRFYILDNIIMIVYFTATKLSHEKGAWHLLIYDTIKRSFYTILIEEWHEREKSNLVSYYYVRKCKKFIFVFGSVKNNYRDFYNIEKNRTVHAVSVITILDLSKISNLNDNSEIENCIETMQFPRWLEKYLETKEREEIFVDCVQADCTVDVNKSILYITAFVPDYKNIVITIAKNICNGNTKFYNFDLGVPVLRTRNLEKDQTKPIYTSSKALKNAGFPRYLHMYDLKGFYDFVNSKTINTGLIFITYPKFFIVDKYYNRISQFYKEFADFYLTISVLLDSYLVGFCKLDHDHTHSLAGLFVINDLTIIQLSL